MCVCVVVLVTKPCPTLYNLMDCSLPGSSVHGISQVRILEWVKWVTISFSGDLPTPGIKPTSPKLAGGFFTVELPGKPHIYIQPKICSFPDDYKSILFKNFLKMVLLGPFFGVNMGQMNITWLMTGRQ